MKNILLFFLIFKSLMIFSQTKVSGRVIDQNGDPIPYANVVFKRSKIGSYSDQDGYFKLYSEKRKFPSIEVSFVGYTSKEIKLKDQDTENLEIVLQEGEQLEEVTIVAKPKKRLSKKENPAYKILQKIWKNKDRNGLKIAEYFQYKKYSSTEVGLNNLDSVFLIKSFGKKDYQDLSKIFDNENQRKYFSVPMYLKEEVENIYGNKDGKLRQDLEAERTQGVAQNGFGLERISRAFREFNIYDNILIVLEKHFVSPISEFGYGSYLYVLSDSIQKDNQTFYTIHFFPKEDQDLLFEGSFSVGDKNFAIEKIQMHTTKKTNLSLVRSLSFEKHFNTENDSLFLPEKDIYWGDFSPISKDENKKGIYVKKEVRFSDYVFNQKLDDEFYSQGIKKIKANQFLQNNQYWDSLPNQNTEMLKTQTLIKNISDNKRIKGISNLLNSLSTGYIPLNHFLQLGSIWELYSPNNIEGSKFKLGFRTFKTPEDRFRIYTYGAYGTKDQQFKYAISSKYLLLNNPRVTIGTSFINDYLQLGSLLFKDEVTMNLKEATMFMFARGNNYFLTKVKKFDAMAGISDLSGNLQFSVMGTYQQMQSADKNHFKLAYFDENRNPVEVFSDANIMGILTYTPKRNVYGWGVEQRYGSNLFPTYSLKLTQGIKGIRNSAFNYTKAEAMVSYPTPVWSLGTFYPTIEAGKIFGKVPLSLMSPTPANQTYTVVDRTFSLLDYYDLVTDSYINFYAEHHFEGFIFNKIPLLKKTKWKSLVFIKGAYGTISKENRDFNASSVNYVSPENLYLEYGFGIENIGIGNFRPVRFDFIWRNNYNDMNGKKTPYFGIRLSTLPKKL